MKLCSIDEDKNRFQTGSIGRLSGIMSRMLNRKMSKSRQSQLEQICRCQNERKLSVFRTFLSILRLARMFYIIYIKKIFDWRKMSTKG